MRILGFLLFVSGSSSLLRAQTAWSIHPDVPSSLSSNAKLKYANNSFRLVWQSSTTYPVSFNNTDLNTAPDIPMPYSVSVSSQTMGIDPAPGSTKKLTIRYATASGQYQAVVQDGSTLNIPSGGHTLVGPAQSVAGFVVVSATYGTTTTFTDVKYVFRTRNISLSYASSFQLNDFTYDGSGSLLLVGKDYQLALAYPSTAGTYQIASSFGYSYFSSDTKACGAYGQGRMVLGFSGSSFSSSSQSQPLLQAPSPGSYSSSSWTSPLIASGFQVKQMIYEAGKFVAVGSRYDSAYSTTSKGAVLISQDGVEWSTVVITGTTSLEAVCYNSGQWVAVGDSGSVLVSPNGYEWTKTTVPGAGSLTSVASGNGYCAVGSSLGKIYTTADFISWNFQMGASGSVSSLAAGDSRFMALVGTKVYQSPFSAAGIADIVSQPASAFTVPQQSVTLSVSATGSGLSYQWYEGISGSTSLPITDATGPSYQPPPLVSTRNYWVRVTNGIGSEESATATLTMQAPPVIAAQPTSKTLAMGSSISSSVTVTGNNVSFQWYQGFSGDVSTPLAGKTSSSLTLPNQLPGVTYYWVKVNNALGTLNSTTIRAEVTPVPPVIVDEPLDTSTYRTVSQSINISASGPSLSYQWYGGVRGDTSRPLPATSTYFYPPDNLVGIYQYWVRVSNPQGYVDSRTAIYSVLDSRAPLITVQPYDTATYVGTSKSISISADGEGLSYAWYAGESGDTSVLLYDSSNGFFPNSTVLGAYRYWVRVSNSSGFVNSLSATYVVKPLGTGLISKHPLNTSTQVDSSVSLSVTATGSGSTYQWYSGVSGDTSNLLSGKTSSTYSPSVTTAGQQSYWVRVTSGTTAENSQTAVLKIITRILAITDPPLDRSTYVGYSFSYYVYTNGSNVTYQWYSGLSGDTSSPLAAQTSYSFSPPVTAAGVFRYWMRATSGAAYVDSPAATVTVIGRPPVLTTQPQNQLLAQGTGSIYLTADVDNTTGITWQWYQGSSGSTAFPLSGKTSSTLSISSPLAGAYTYWVRATNPYGVADSRTATVTVSPVLYADWLVQNGLPSNGSGLGAFGASPNGDGVSNLLKYVLGMNAYERFDANHGPQIGTRNIGGSNYLTLKFVQSLTTQTAQLSVEESTSLSNWSATAIECGPSYDNGDGTMTRTFRHSQSMGSGSGYLRLKASSN